MDENVSQSVAIGVGGTRFTYTHANIANLGETAYSLFALAVDVSGSVTPFLGDIQNALKNSIIALKKDKRVAHNVLASVSTFGSNVTELHGFLEMRNIDENQYNLQIEGTTELIPASVTGLSSIKNLGEQLEAQDFKVNGILIVITDGEDTSRRNPAEVARLKAEIIKEEKVESVTSILIGVTSSHSISAALNRFKNEASFDHYVELSDSSPESIAKIVGIISKSVSSSSASLGSGQAPSLSF